MDETEYLLHAPANAENLRQSMQELEGSRGLRLKVIEQDGEKFLNSSDKCNGSRNRA